MKTKKLLPVLILLNTFFLVTSCGGTVSSSEQSQSSTNSESTMETTSSDSSTTDTSNDTSSDTSSDGTSSDTSSGDSSEPEDDNPMKNYARKLYRQTGQDFKILNLTDTQLHDGDDFESAKHIIDTLVEREHPDMITLLGDIINDDVTYGVEVSARKMIELIDSYDIPWAPVFGNHDNLEYQAPGSKKTGGVPFLMGLFAESDNCLFIEGPSTVHGKSNYMVNVLDTDGSMLESLIFLDSFTNGLEDSNVEFYEDCVAYATELNKGASVPSIVFDHIPIPEYETAYNNAKDIEYRNLTGNAGKNTLSAGTTNMFRKIKELGSTTTVVCGHDHDAAYITEFDGIKLAFAMKSTLGDNKEDSNNTHPLGGLVINFGEEEELYFSRVEDITYELKASGNFVYNAGVLPYWRSSGAKLEFDIEMPSTGSLKFNLQGTNHQRGSVDIKARKGNWNRLTNNTNIGTDETNLASFGTMTNISDNLYHYEADLSNWTLNSGEDACGDETAVLLYFHTVTGGNFKLTNIHYEYEEITETNQLDLVNAVIDDIPDVMFYNLPVKPDPVVKLGGVTLNKVDDIIYDYTNNGAIGTATLRIIPSGKGAHRYKGQVTKIFNVVAGETIRGEMFTAGQNYSKDIPAIALTHKLYIDVKFTTSNETHINMFIGDGWSNYFGYYNLYPTTKTGDYFGISVDNSLGDGYIRFIFDLSELKNSDQADFGGNKSQINKINLVHIRNWSDASGYIDIIEQDVLVDTNRGGF